MAHAQFRIFGSNYFDIERLKDIVQLKILRSYNNSEVFEGFLIGFDGGLGYAGVTQGV